MVRLLETFYRAARKTTGLLMDGALPAGGAWNLDAENRQTWKGKPPVPPRPSFPADAITREVLALVEDRYPHAFGSLARVDWPVTAEDAMADAEPALFHSLLSPSIKLGLLDPLDLCRRAETAWRRGKAPLASVEGSTGGSGSPTWTLTNGR